MRKNYTQLIINKYLAEHEVRYIAGIECSIGWYESCATQAEAVKLLRELVEADGHHVFMRYDPVSFGRSYGERNKLLGKVVWCNTLTGKTETKRIKVEGATVADIKELQELREWSYNARFLEWEALHGKEY